MDQKKPFIIKYPSIGNPEIGYVSVAEKEGLLFDVKRIYWTYATSESVERGNHAHKTLHQILFAVSGSIKIRVENTSGFEKEFLLDNPEEGLFIPPIHWRTLQFSNNAVLLCLASAEYEESDYIRDYNEFKRLK